MLSLKDFNNTSKVDKKFICGGQDHKVTGTSHYNGYTWEDWEFSDGSHACDVFIGRD